MITFQYWFGGSLFKQRYGSVFEQRRHIRYEEPPTSLTQLWHPPAELATIGRANRPGRPMLYLSTDIGPVFYELNAQVDSRLTVVKYVTEASMMLNKVGYTAGAFNALKASRSIPDYCTMDVDRYSDVGNLVNDFLSEVFCQVVPMTEPWRYGPSAAIAELLLGQRERPINGIMYPTIPMWGNAENVALRPRFAATSLRPVIAQFTRVTKVDPPNIKYEVIDESRVFGENGDISWLGHQGKWELEPLQQLKLEAMRGNYWVACDLDGFTVNPT